MANSDMKRTGKQITWTVAYGLAALVLYLLLYALEDHILALSALGGWYFVVPVATAFVFSFVHGAFTGHFWDVFGVKARK